MIKCEKCKQDPFESKRVLELKKEVFRLKQIAKQLATAQTIEDRDAIAEQHQYILGGE